RLLALSKQDTQLISDVLDLTKKDTSLLNSIHQQATQITALKNDVSKAQYTAIASSENLLINPRGKINQTNESDGVLTAGQYFCDGWKAGAAGAEVYRDADGFRLVSGSIVQLVPNTIDVGLTLRGNMDTVSGTPQIHINGGTDTATADSQQYIKFEVSGNGSKFTRLILAESSSLPIYQQPSNELPPCQRFLIVSDRSVRCAVGQLHQGQSWMLGVANVGFASMVKKPAVSVTPRTGCQVVVSDVRPDGFTLTNASGTPTAIAGITAFVADARL
ncbi:hypothetical protein, partial [Vibrio sp. 10N.222.49.B4]|uniref:hypothetical protein n=1 Tax=Vibrio sp. 10N.222.49.B4 TaxID=3229613 RepID=UPI003553FA27